VRFKELIDVDHDESQLHVLVFAAGGSDRPGHRGDAARATGFDPSVCMADGCVDHRFHGGHRSVAGTSKSLDLEATAGRSIGLELQAAESIPTSVGVARCTRVEMEEVR